MLNLKQTADKSLSAISETYLAAHFCEESWAYTDTIDIGEAEHLVRCVRDIPTQALKTMRKTSAIAKYAKKTPAWDNDTMAEWPVDIVKETSEILVRAGLAENQ